MGIYHSAGLVAKQLSSQHLATLAYALKKGMEAEKAIRELPKYVQGIIYGAATGYSLKRFLEVILEVSGRR